MVHLVKNCFIIATLLNMKHTEYETLAHIYILVYICWIIILLWEKQYSRKNTIIKENDFLHRKLQTLKTYGLSHYQLIK